MTDKEIIQGLIDRNNRVTEEFFFRRCRPMFFNIMKFVFDYEVEYDELVNELYIYLMEGDAAKLKAFKYRSSVYQWIKVLAIRYFIKKRNNLIDDTSHETLKNRNDQESLQDTDMTAESDLERLFELMPNKRYVQVIRRLIIEDCEPEQFAQEINVTTANLYNIKRRAMAQLSMVALKDIKEYGQQ